VLYEFYHLVIVCSIPGNDYFRMRFN